MFKNMRFIVLIVFRFPFLPCDWSFSIPYCNTEILSSANIVSKHFSDISNAFWQFFRSQFSACFLCLLIGPAIKKVRCISDSNKKGTPFIRHRRPEYGIYSLPKRFFCFFASVPFCPLLYEHWIRRFPRIWVIWWFWVEPGRTHVFLPYAKQIWEWIFRKKND